MMSISPASSHVVIACGGTGGHLFPGLAVGEALMRFGAQVELMISQKDVDRRAAQEIHDLKVTALPAVAMQKGAGLSFFHGAASSARQCMKRFRARRPVAVLAMGGFTGAGPVIAARVLGIPVFLHESNTVPGRANRLLARFASTVFVGFPSAQSRFGRKGRYVGTPVRPKLSPAEEGSCRRLLGLDPDRPVIAVLGGSQGAQAVNEAVMKTLVGARSMVPDWQWVHLTGAADEHRVRESYVREGVDALVCGFSDQMEIILGAASAAITRAGGSSMAELAAMRIPSVLVPYPHAADNHQFQNACAFESTGAAVLIEQADLQSETLLAALRPMVEDEAVRARMRSALTAWHKPDAAEVVAEYVLGRASDNVRSHGADLHRRKALVA